MVYAFYFQSPASLQAPLWLSTVSVRWYINCSKLQPTQLALGVSEELLYLERANVSK